ncbi:hypothetical protein [Pseudofulvibacter geojedonensis]|uniref:Uncharacterized protein n=1 Tax=Pseudofulvibacter geojedonensis TaxID=1123758 RepID=A0ABW3I174_9FLAO
MNNIISEIELIYKPNFGKEDRIKITGSKKAFKTFLSNWNKDTIELQEEFKIMLLKNSNEVLGIHTLAKGGMTLVM